MYDDFFVSSGEFELKGWGFGLAALFFGLASYPEGYNKNKNSYISSYNPSIVYYPVHSEKIKQNNTSILLKVTRFITKHSLCTIQKNVVLKTKSAYTFLTAVTDSSSLCIHYTLM